MRQSERIFEKKLKILNIAPNAIQAIPVFTEDGHPQFDDSELGQILNQGLQSLFAANHRSTIFMQRPFVVRPLRTK